MFLSLHDCCRYNIQKNTKTGTACVTRVCLRAHVRVCWAQLFPLLPSCQLVLVSIVTISATLTTAILYVLPFDFAATSLVMFCTIDYR